MSIRQCRAVFSFRCAVAVVNLVVQVRLGLTDSTYEGDCDTDELSSRSHDVTCPNRDSEQLPARAAILTRQHGLYFDLKALHS